MASEEQISFNEPHKPHPNSIEAFTIVSSDIVKAITRSRKDWDGHEPRMWSRASGISDDQLIDDIDLERDLVLVRSGETTYGVILLGKIKVGTNDNEDGFIHVRIHHPAGTGAKNWTFHSIWTDEGNRGVDGKASTYNAIQWLDTPLEFFNE
ncbi:hypothetical protein M407DRAFT_245951 [Tulasnella calospora MUT 4182]|uniref:Uncharacterized protein n=1 Tax=Tulasnella calospora MUT 4182 TaxID=1051891 RepID=A0A0C3Q7P8_9AGAM|nr:hypothetical protein M407DRAFT_245951 [Tulasnella calospora MUT 4182]